MQESGQLTDNLAAIRDSKSSWQLWAFSQKLTLRSPQIGFGLLLLDLNFGGDAKSDSPLPSAGSWPRRWSALPRRWMNWRSLPRSSARRRTSSRRWGRPSDRELLFEQNRREVYILKWRNNFGNCLPTRADGLFEPRNRVGS